MDNRNLPMTEYVAVMNGCLSELQNCRINYLNKLNDESMQTGSNLTMIKDIENEYAEIGRELIKLFSKLMNE